MQLTITSTTAVVLKCLALFLVSQSEAFEYCIIPSESMVSDTECNQYSMTNVTDLDNFAMNILPNLQLSDSAVEKLKLHFATGIHNSNIKVNISLNFTDIHISGFSRVNDAENSLAGSVLYLHCCRITLSAYSTIFITNISINGDRNYGLILESTPHIELEHVAIVNIYVFMNDPGVAPSRNETRIKVSSVLFKMSKFTFKHDSVVDSPLEMIIENSTFLHERRLNTVALCINKQKAMSFITIRNTIFCGSSTSNESKLVIVVNENCRSIQTRPTEVYLSASSNIQLEISNSEFYEIEGLALQIELQNGNLANVSIQECILSNCKLGAISLSTMFLDELNFILRDSLIINNNMSTDSLEVLSPGLSIYGHDYRASTKCLVTNCTFEGNSDMRKFSATFLLYRISDITICNTVFKNNIGTAINAYNSNIFLSGSVVIVGNSAYSGAGLYIESSTLYINKGATILFHNNTAVNFGGGIFVNRFQFRKGLPCFYQLVGYEYDTNYSLSFSNNHAGMGGSHIFGASIDTSCYVSYNKYIRSDNLMDIFSFSEPYLHSLSSISSTATRLCMCDTEGQPQCDDLAAIFVSNFTVYPGEIFTISVIAVGTQFGTTVATSYAKFLTNNNNNHVRLSKHYQATQKISNVDSCTHLNYSVVSQSPFEVMYLTTSYRVLQQYGDIEQIRKDIQTYHEQKVIEPSLLNTPLFFNLSLLPCPSGFVLTKDRDNPSCDCHPQLSRNTNIYCTIVNGIGYVSRHGRLWISVRHQENIPLVVFCEHCPIGYCNKSIINVDFENNSDVQCAFNRAGQLCGGCLDGYSLAIGSSHCIKCVNNYNAFLLIFFIVAGLILVGFISLLDLTITNGTINGLIFYANVVWSYQSRIFPTTNSEHFHQATISFFRVFIAWLNLDFGIETCFVRGLNAYTKSFLQFLFPVYVWFITISIIIVFKWIPTTSKRWITKLRDSLIGNKAVSILVTLILLSYTKLARAIIDVFYSADLKILSKNSTLISETVWALDGNIYYSRGSHIALLVISSIFGLATLMYTLYIFFVGLRSTTCTQTCICMRAWTYKCQKTNKFHGDLRSWMSLELKDAHFDPFTNDHQYWLGLLLIIRITFLVSFVSLAEAIPDLNLLIILITSCALLVYLACIHIFKYELVKILQCFSFGNLMCLSGGILFADFKNKPDWRSAIVLISFTFALIHFFVIIFYHILIRFMPSKSITCFQCIQCNFSHQERVDVEMDTTNASFELRAQTVNGLREPLIDSDCTTDRV